MDLDRKNVRILLAATVVLALAVAIVALWKAGGTDPGAWAAVAAAMAVVAAAVSAWTSLKVVELQEDALLPQLVLSVDARSRYGLTQLVLANRGATSAFDVAIAWLDHPRNEDGKPIEFGTDGKLAILGAGEKSTVYLGESSRFFIANPNTTFSAHATYSTSKGDSKTAVLRASTAPEVNALYDNEESARTHHELQKLPKAIEKLTDEVRKALQSNAPSGSGQV
jgi:hypothetical protein